MDVEATLPCPTYAALAIALAHFAARVADEQSSANLLAQLRELVLDAFSLGDDDVQHRLDRALCNSVAA